MVPASDEAPLWITRFADAAATWHPLQCAASCDAMNIGTSTNFAQLGLHSGVPGAMNRRVHEQIGDRSKHGREA